MSDDPKSEPPAAAGGAPKVDPAGTEPDAAEPAASTGEAPAAPAPQRPSFARSLIAADPVSIGALATAVVASIVSVVQTAFMWEARNDEIEAELRAQQLRACVAYERRGAIANARIQALAISKTDPADGDEALDGHLADYFDTLAELGLLMPSTLKDTLIDTQNEALAAEQAFEDGDYEKMLALSNSQSRWSQLHVQIQNACSDVIRNVRDRGAGALRPDRSPEEARP